MSKQRGSEVLKKFQGRQHTFDDASLRHLAEVADHPAVQLVDWWIYGTPAIDRFIFTLEVDQAAIGQFSQAALGGQERRYLVVHHPIGVPAIERFSVQYSNAPLTR